MFQDCIRIHSEKKDGSDMRPRTPTPDKHWTGMLYGHYQQHSGIQIAYPQDRVAPEIHISKDFWRQCADGFGHIMGFIRSNGLTVSINRGECAVCSGRDTCVSNG